MWTVHQALLNGQQVEHPDNWLRYGTPWETARPSQLHPVRFYGRVTQHMDREGRLISRWEDCEEVMALAYDLLVPGYRNERVNTLRLWSAKATREFDLRYFNHGDYIQAVQTYNTEVRTFPGRLWAVVYSATPMATFTTTEENQQPPTVQF